MTTEVARQTQTQEKAPPRPWVAGVLAAFLAAFLAGVPLAQLAEDLRQGRPPQALDVFRQAPRLENLQAYERALERDSVVAKAVRPYVQWAFTRVLRAGNEKVVVGRDGWLFYRPSVKHVTGAGSLARPAPGGGPSGGDPLGAILHFRDSLAACGVGLLVVPVPGKESIYPERLGAGCGSAGPPENADTPRFLAALAREGVAVLDLAPLLWEAKARSAGPLYLPGDTHWSPAGMALAADALARRIREGGHVSGRHPTPWRVQPRRVTHRGDLYDMLNLPAGAAVIAPTEVAIERVVHAETGSPCSLDRASPVLILGDSFVNVFSDGELGWGDSAGLAEQLALRLGTGVDVIALNDGGVNGSRERLARRPGGLAGRRLVVWQFAARDLSLKAGEWKRVPVRPAGPGR